MAALFDTAHFDHMTGGDRALQAEILSLFRAQVDGWSVAMNEGGWRAAVHTVKGSARGIGLMTLAETCEAAERAQDTDAAAALAQVRAALDQALAALDQFVADAA